MINSIVALPKENEQQLLFYCKYKWLSIILINYCYYIIIRIFDGGWMVWQKVVLAPSFKHSCSCSHRQRTQKWALQNISAVHLLQEMNLPAGRKWSTIHTVPTFCMVLLYPLCLQHKDHFPLSLHILFPHPQILFLLSFNLFLTSDNSYLIVLHELGKHLTLNRLYSFALSCISQHRCCGTDVVIRGWRWDSWLVVIAGTRVEALPSLEGGNSYCRFLSTGDLSQWVTSALFRINHPEARPFKWSWSPLCKIRYIVMVFRQDPLSRCFLSPPLFSFSVSLAV